MMVRLRSLGQSALATLVLACGACTAIPGVDPAQPQTGGLTLENRYVEAPEIFSLSADAISDGEATLAGIWAAVPDPPRPERIRIVNTETGAVVIGGLFERDDTRPGPPVRLSSEAAQVLGAPQDTPIAVTITALRLELLVRDTTGRGQAVVPALSIRSPVPRPRR